MPIEIDPKKQFLQNPDDVKAFDDLIHQPIFKKAITLAYAHYAQNMNVSTQQLHGAREFMDVLNFFCEKSDPPRRLPSKELKTFDGTELTLPPANTKPAEPKK